MPHEGFSLKKDVFKTLWEMLQCVMKPGCNCFSRCHLHLSNNSKHLYFVGWNGTHPFLHSDLQSSFASCLSSGALPKLWCTGLWTALWQQTGQCKPQTLLWVPGTGHITWPVSQELGQSVHYKKWDFPPSPWNKNDLKAKKTPQTYKETMIKIKI